MTSELMLYATKVALLISLAALALERMAVWRGLPRRGIWSAALALSVALPTVGLVRGPYQPIGPAPSAATQPYPSVAALPAPDTQLKSRETTPSIAISLQPAQRHFSWPGRVLIEEALLRVWLAASAGLVVVYTLISLRLRLARRFWRREQLDGQVVWVTEALGPGVCGLLQPVILMPGWVLESPPKVRSLVLAHEREHILARDPALLLFGLMMVAVAPWNLLLWWQLRRMRFAIEVDCDARVLRGGEKAEVYGRALLAVGERGTSVPVGAIALTEPASQLQRRIRVIIGDLPRRSNWAVAGAVGFCVASLAVAADFQAPALEVSASSRDPAELRKLPVGGDPREAAAEELVRKLYPELFGASAPTHPVLVTLLMNENGALNKSFKEDTEPTPWVPKSLDFATVGDEHEYRPGVKLRLKGLPAAGNYVDVRTWYRKPIRDPSRDVAVVRAKVRARYAALFRPVYADGSSMFREGISLVTVFMTENGDIDRAQAEVSTGVAVDKDVDAELAALATPQRFAAMGVPNERIGPIGTTQLYSGHYSGDRDSRTLLVIYAWPRRANDAQATREPAEQQPAAAVNDDPQVNRAIAERYFPDLYTHPQEWPRADPWVLLDRQGRVQETGRRVVMSGRDIRLYVESLYPGIRIGEVQVTTVQRGPGQRADVGFVWLAADSPVTDVSKANLSGRDALLLYADVIGEGMRRPTELMKLQVGAPALTACSGGNPFGVVYVQVTAVEVGSDAVTARIRVLHAPLRASGETEVAPESAWSREFAEVRVPYGGAADVQVPDQNGKTWQIVLHPERLGPGRS